MLQYPNLSVEFQFALMTGRMCPVGTENEVISSTYCNIHSKRVGVTVKDQFVPLLCQAAR